jgi:acyl dehydratase
MRYFEDIEAGDVHDLGSYEVTEEEVLEFAERYDPQPFHVDAAQAEQSMFGGLIASGWHTASICMRLLVDGYLSDAASAGARGVDDLRWIAPVRPGDTIRAELEVLETEPANARTGNVRSKLTGFVDGDPVIRWESDGIFERRSAQTD